MKKITTIILFLGLTLCSLAQNGAYTGKAEAIVGGAIGPFESKNTLEYTITQNTDNTINVTMCEAEYNVTLMGDIRLGEYIVSNIPYDSSKGAYFLDYASQNLNVDITLKNNKKNYIISKLGNITVSFEDDKVIVKNNIQPGNMPFDVQETFNGTKSVAGIAGITDNGLKSPSYNINGSYAKKCTKGIIIRDGKKYINR